MTIYTSISIGGSVYNDIENIRVTKRLSEISNGGEFSTNFWNVGGRHKSNFTVGNEVLIYAGSPTANGSIFTGILEDIEYSGYGEEEKISLSGRDYTARLMDVTVEPEVYTNQLAGSIVKDIMDKYVSNVTTGSVQNSNTTIKRMVFNHTNCYDAIKQLAEISGYIFYVDEAKILHFEPANSTSSGYSLHSGNVIDSSVRTQRDQIYNKVWVYGDRYLDGLLNWFNVGSLTGSVLSVPYKPHNSLILWNGSAYRGGVFEMNLTPSSGTQYMVSFHDKQVIFTSGTSLGDNVPTGTGSGYIQYYRDLPIVKYTEDRTSIANYGARSKVIINKDIKDPNMAADLMNATLNKYKEPIDEATLKIRGITSLTPGNTIQVNLPFQDIAGSVFQITEVNYDFNLPNNKKEQVLTIKVE